MHPSRAFILASTITVALSCPPPSRPPTSSAPPSRPPVSSPPPSRPPLLTPRGLLDWITTGVDALSSGAELVLGVTDLASSTIDVAETCDGVIDCFVDVADTVWTGVTEVFLPSDNTKRAATATGSEGSEGGLPEHGHFVSARTNKTYIAHLPLVGNRTLREAAARSGSKSWVRAATVWHGEREVQRLMYRLAAEEDLGRVNDGRTHHFRAVVVGSGKREVDKGQGLTVDSMWRDSDETIWGDVRGFDSAADGLAQASAEWMQQNNAQVACAVPGIQTSDLDTAMDQQLLSWNKGNTEYNYKGQAGDFLSQCGDGGSKSTKKGGK